MNKQIRKLVLAAMCLALALLLPFLTGQIPEIGQALSPMHIPALLCGFICGPFWGAVVGAVAPLLRHLLTGGMPPLLTAIAMTFELAAYGFTSGILYRFLPKKIPYIYVSLICAMIAGRIIWGIVQFIISIAQASSFTFSAFIAGAITGAIPGIICHIIIVPLIFISLKRAKFLPEGN